MKIKRYDIPLSPMMAGLIVFNYLTLSLFAVAYLYDTGRLDIAVKLSHYLAAMSWVALVMVGYTALLVAENMIGWFRDRRKARSSLTATLSETKDARTKGGPYEKTEVDE